MSMAPRRLPVSLHTLLSVCVLEKCRQGSAWQAVRPWPRSCLLASRSPDGQSETLPSGGDLPLSSLAL